MVEGLVSKISGRAGDSALRMAGAVLPPSAAAIAAGPLAEALDRATNANAAQMLRRSRRSKSPNFRRQGPG
jgi:isoaspartyl peptidase/L-asparaginase-like protein (Ntn-hydrolase superfamily)